MNQLRFGIEKSYITGSIDTVLLDGDEDPTTALVEQVIQNLGTDLEITISGVTMFLSAWQDPEHWATDWAEKLVIDHEDAPEAVAELIGSAIEKYERHPK